VFELFCAGCGNGESPARVNEGVGDWVCGGVAGGVDGLCSEELGGRGEGDDGEWTGPEAGG